MDYVLVTELETVVKSCSRTVSGIPYLRQSGNIILARTPG
jgi:hypothetical protein